LERLGFFCLDPDSTPDRPVLNRIVTLKDSWAQTKASAAPRKARPAKSPRTGPTPEKRLDDAARHYVSEHGVSEEQALVLSADPHLATLFEETLEAGAPPETAAAWISGPVRRHVKAAKGVAHLRYDAQDLAGLLRRLGDADLTRAQAREGLETLATTGALPQFESGGDLETTLDDLLTRQEEPLARYRSGEKQLFGFFMGEAMRATRGAFDPGQVRAALRRKLEA
ncbi:MAG: hypothetical protein VX747_08370, partial [Actinomycetota bacterium]|nr:hypothetical protein [Actinomycetota bacterium]